MQVCGVVLAKAKSSGPGCKDHDAFASLATSFRGTRLGIRVAKSSQKVVEEAHRCPHGFVMFVKSCCTSGIFGKIVLTATMAGDFVFLGRL